MEATSRVRLNKWFILLIATLTLCTVVSATGVLFVKPTNDTLCPQQPCHTLEHYAQSWQLYLTSNTVVQFLPGEHVLEGDWNELAVVNISNLTLVGSDSAIPDSSPLGIPMATSRINCRRGRTMFTFYSVTELFIARLTFSECGRGKATLILDEVSNLVLDRVTIQNSTGTGLFGINLRESLIHHSAFIFNQAANAFYCSGNVFLLYSICSEGIETYTLNITSSWILFGNATTDANGGGLCLQVSQSCYNVKVNIHNTTFKENVGGNMMILLEGFAGNIITIADSHFEGGYSSSTGGGLQLATSNDISQVAQHVQNNHVYINNTEFVGNYALLSGGAISVFPRTGTELYINASKFYNNVAFEGGHIAITWTVSTHRTCGSVIININHSLFENGTAYDGGGVIIKGPNGNHISVSNTHFVRNYAQFRGGALSLHGHTSNTIQMAISCYNISRVPQSNLMYINNTEFVGNYAKSGGAVAIHPSTGTELHINASKFHNNVAHDGGHIDILLLLSSFTYTNATITIKYSLLKDGSAFSGGGVVVRGPYNTFQLMNDSHITISNTQFMGNYAEQNGGALSLYGCVGTELYIVESEFYNNTTPKNGGHIGVELLSLNYNLYITVNNSHFESGKAHVGAGILVFAIPDPHDSCTSVNNSLQKSVHIMNSKVYRNIADFGGGLAIQFNQRCYVIEVLVHNVSLSKNAATNSSGGNLHLRTNTCTAQNFVTISRSILEYGNASFSGGGMKFQTDISEACSTSLVSIKPTIFTIAHSTFQYNTARYQGGGLAILLGLAGPPEYFCCSAEVNIMNVTFLNNKVSTVPYIYADIGKKSSTSGGNIYIYDISGNNSVRIHDCLIEGGVAMIGGGISLIQSVKYLVSWQNSTEIEGLFISSSQLICNQATEHAQAASLDYKVLKNISTMLNIWKPSITKTFTITDTTIDGSCANDSVNVNIIGFGLIAPYFPTWYSVIFVNVSFRGYSTNTSLPPSIFHSQELSNVSSDGNVIHKPNTVLLQEVVLVSVQNATFIDCEFLKSSGSALAVLSSNMFFGGNITFRENIAIVGAGLRLHDSSVMYLRPNTHIMFSSNHATYAGGAIYIESAAASSNLNCFYQLDGINQDISDPNIQITFENNTANFAGSALYGGLVDFCSLEPPVENNFFDFLFKVQNTDDDPTAISSDPYRVCPCNNSKPVCGIQTDTQVWPIYTYPGALFHVQAVVVGQKNGIVPGVVRAAVQNASAVLGDLQQSQATGKSCTTLNYTVFSTHTEEIITLKTEGILGRMILSQLIINVTLLNCPWGFTLTGAPPKCDCVDELQSHHITCNITTQTITRSSTLWIGYYHSDNNTEHPVEGVLVHDHCPFDYCKPEQLPIQLNDSDKQCAFNRSGILCGACQPGLSLALGTSRCLQCSNKYLMLLFAFTAAGLALVFLLTLTNMTVSEGTINGLIFYANIIHINQAIFFPNESTGVNKIILNILSIFIAWINLDLGIETCFYNGMDMYTKAWLQFLFPIYIWTIVGGMIVSSHYSTTAAKLFRRHAVKVLATLFLLSFAKLQRTIITALSFTFLTYPDGTKTVWLYDSNIEYLHGKHIPLFTAALLALLFLLIPYTSVLFFIQCLSKFDCRIFFWVKKLKPLFDAYTGPYKDKYRFWTGFLLIVRTILFLIFTLGNPGLNLAAIGITSTCLAFTPAVYKKVWLTLLEYSLLLNLSAVSVATFYCRDPQSSGNQAVVVYVSVGTALVTFIGILAYHLCQCTINSRAWKTVSDRVTQRSSNRELVNIAAEGSDEEEEEEPAQAEMRPLMLQFNEYREPVLVYDD